MKLHFVTFLAATSLMNVLGDIEGEVHLQQFCKTSSNYVYLSCEWEAEGKGPAGKGGRNRKLKRVGEDSSSSSIFSSKRKRGDSNNKNTNQIPKDVVAEASISSTNTKRVLKKEEFEFDDVQFEFKDECTFELCNEYGEDCEEADISGLLPGKSKYVMTWTEADNVADYYKFAVDVNLTSVLPGALFHGEVELTFADATGIVHKDSKGSKLTCV